MRAALYARISTRDQHSIPMQLDAMRQYAELRGWEIVAEVSEAETGKKDDRPGRKQIVSLAHKGKLDVVICWKLNRWGRSTPDLLMSLDDLQAHRCSFVSLSEQIDLTSPTGRMMAGILAVFAQFEREMLVENVKAGVAAYRKKNGKWGPTPYARAKSADVLRLKAEGKTVTEIARELGIARPSVYRALKAEPVAEVGHA